MFGKFITTMAMVLVTLTGVGAQSLDAPAGAVFLTVSGNVSNTNDNQTAKLDLEMLMGLEKTTIKTSTIWTDGVQVFEGVALVDLVEALGITAQTLRATAVNDYSVNLPMSDAIEGGPIVAYHLNGKTMSLRDKGPLWIVYPYDSEAKYRTEVIYSRSIWQLDRIEALD